MRIRRQLRALARLQNGKDDGAHEGGNELRDGGVDVENTEIDAAQLTGRAVSSCAAVLNCTDPSASRLVDEAHLDAAGGKSPVGRVAGGGPRGHGVRSAAELVDFHAKEGGGRPHGNAPGDAAQGDQDGGEAEGSSEGGQEHGKGEHEVAGDPCREQIGFVLVDRLDNLGDAGGWAVGKGVVLRRPDEGRQDPGADESHGRVDG